MRKLSNGKRFDTTRYDDGTVVTLASGNKHVRVSGAVQATIQTEYGPEEGWVYDWEFCAAEEKPKRKFATPEERKAWLLANMPQE